MSVRKRIHEYIDSRVDRLVDSTVRFIKTPSPSGSEGDKILRAQAPDFSRVVELARLKYGL